MSSSKRDGTSPSNTPHDQSGTGQPSWYQAAGCPPPQVSRLWSKLCHQLRSQSLLHRLECQQPIAILSQEDPMWPGLSLVLGYGTMGGKNYAFSPTLTSPIALCGLGTVREVLLEWTVLELALPSRPCLSCPIDPGLLSCHPVQTGGVPGCVLLTDRSECQLAFS